LGVEEVYFQELLELKKGRGLKNTGLEKIKKFIKNVY